MIKCSKCGAELSDDTKFCSYCGNKIEATIPQPIKEETIIPDVPLNSFDNTTAKKSDAPKSLADKTKDKASEKWHKLSTYGKITTAAIIAFTLLCLIAFLFGKTAAGIIAVLQIVLTVVAVLMQKQIIKTPKSWLHIIAFVLAIVLLVPYVSLFSVDYGDADKFAWSDILLADVVPEPDSLFGEIISNYGDYLSVYTYKTTLTDYNEYVEACKEKGFTVEADQSERSYYAYNDDGYKLSLYYDANDSKMHIGVDAAKQYGTLVWSDSVIARMLPVPISTTGEITQDDEKGFQAYVSNTTIDEFKAYAVACADKGFNIDASEYDESYSATNSEGYKISISYQGNSVISISVDEPEYEVSIEIECVENWIFSKYDVDVYIDDMLEGTITHGATETIAAILTKGTYEIKFVSAEDDNVTGTVAVVIQKNETFKYKISCSSSDIDVETIAGTASGGKTDEAANRTEKNGFDSATNESHNLARYTVEIPKYWNSERSISGGLQWYAETGGKVALLQIAAQAETDNSYPVTFDGLMDDNSNMITMIEATAFKEVTDYEVIDTGVIKGILYKGTIIDKDSGLSGYGEWFAFASEQDRTWCTLIMCQTDNTEYLYTEDFIEIIKSIEEVPIETTTTTTPPKPSETTGIILPTSDSKLCKDFDSKGSETVYYINVDGSKNVSKLVDWGTAVVTDGVAEYFNYLQSLGYSITVTSTNYREPYSGFHAYDTNFKVEGPEVSWTMSLFIQDEKYVEYELDINIP